MSDRALRITFEPGTPDSIRTIVEREFPLIHFCAPTWLREITFKAAPLEEHRLAHCFVSTEYRTLHITLSDRFPVFDARKQCNIIAHEICHAWFETQSDMIRSVMTTLGTDRESALMKDLYTERLEAAVEDLAVFMINAFELLPENDA